MTINVWLAYIVGGLYLLLLGALAVLLVINADQRAALAAANSAAVVLQAQNKQWAAKTAATDAALAKNRAAEAANAKAIAKAQAAARQAGQMLKDQAAHIAALRLTGNDCAQIKTLRDQWMQRQQ